MDTPAKKPLFESVVDSSAFLALISAFLFLLGLAYLEGFWRYFGIDVFALDYPFYVYPSYAWAAGLPEAWWAIVALCGLYLASDVLRRFIDPMQGVWFKILLYPALSLVILVLAGGTALWHGRQKGADQFKSGTQVNLTFRGDNRNTAEASLIRANTSGSLRLLGQTKDLVIVFEKPESQPDRKTISLFVVRRSDLSSVHLWTRIP